jgi:hypothetical protein
MPDETQRPAEPVPEHKKPETEPGNPNKPQEPKRQDDGQQTG